jgi:hypothetical protein
MQGNVGYLNIEYILLRAYDLIAHFRFVVDGSPTWFPALVTDIIVIGMCASLLMLILAVYAHIRTLQVEHAGFHALEEHAHEHHDEEVESTGKNDHWERIVELAGSGSQSDWRRAILEADIMLGDVLATHGYTGPTIADQLKLTNPLQVTTIRSAWDAHMMRNKVAHGGESFMLDERDTRTTIDQYKRVFEELGAI